MRIDILSVVPELLESPLNHSIIKRARDKGVVDIHIHNIRDWSKDKFRKVDDYPFGGEAGLVMMIQPIVSHNWFLSVSMTRLSIPLRMPRLLIRKWQMSCR